MPYANGDDDNNDEYDNSDDDNDGNDDDFVDGEKREGTRKGKQGVCVCGGAAQLGSR